MVTGKDKPLVEKGVESTVRTPLPDLVAVIGGGPAGLMAAEQLAKQGVRVEVFDAMPSVGRKFLLAGIGGLNITHSEAYATFCGRYADRLPYLQPMLDAFTPGEFREWVHALGVDTFVGSSGRVFPKEMKAAPLLRAWLHRLRLLGVRLHVRHRWLGWTADERLKFSTSIGEVLVKPQATVLALGGASWPKLGSDGAWVPWLAAKGVPVATLQSANCGFEVAWSNYLRENYAGSPVKNIAMVFTDSQGQAHGRLGEVLISADGIEGSLIYAYSREIRLTLEATGSCVLHIDLLPTKSLADLQWLLSKRPPSKSMAAYLKAKLGVGGVKLALLREVLNQDSFNQPLAMAACLKALPVRMIQPRPLAEAISTAGGVQFSALNSDLMLKAMPGVFATGEMLDWEAPTGGYLLTACMATGLHAGNGVLAWLRATASATSMPSTPADKIPPA